MFLHNYHHQLPISNIKYNPVATEVTTETAIRKINNVILKKESRYHYFHEKL